MTDSNPALRAKEIRHYTEAHSPELEFEICHRLKHPQEDSINYVSMHEAKKAEKGKSLVATGLGYCFALLIKNQTSHEVALLHISNPELSEEQITFLRALQQPDDRLIGLMIKGEGAMDKFDEATNTIETILPEMRYKIISIDRSRGPYWGMAYRPEKDELLVEVGAAKEVRIWNPFTQMEQSTTDWQNRTTRKDFGVA